jgi:hypothetical protein
MSALVGGSNRERLTWRINSVSAAPAAAQHVQSQRMVVALPLTFRDATDDDAMVVSELVNTARGPSAWSAWIRTAQPLAS